MHVLFPTVYERTIEHTRKSLQNLSDFVITTYQNNLLVRLGRGGVDTEEALSLASDSPQYRVILALQEKT